MEKNVEYYNIGSIEDIMNTCMIQLHLTNACNMKCWYCYAESTNYDNYFFTKTMFKKLLKFIDAQEKENVSVQMIGGEPTLNKNLFAYIEEIRDRYNADIYVTTNLCKGINYWKKFPEGATIEASLHKPEDHEFFIKKALYLEERGILDIIYLMASGVNDKEVIKLYEKYKDILPVEIVPIYQRKSSLELPQTHSVYKKALDETSKYNGKPEVILEDGSNDIKNCEKYKNFKGMFCNSGFYIDQMANVYWCQKYTKNKNPFMNLLIDKIKKISKWHVCEINICDRDVQFQKCSVKYMSNLKEYI